jgi:hypothetical protein
MGTATHSMFQDSITSDQLRFGIPTATRDSATGRRTRNGWVWIPLSFVFVIVGLLLGMLISASVGSRLPGPLRHENPYTLGVSVAKSGEGLLLRWDRSSPAIEKAAGGQLLIKENGGEKAVPLDALQLRNGSVIYRNTSDDVTFRLDVHATGTVTLSEQIRHKP